MAWPKGVPRKPQPTEGAVVSERSMEEVMKSTTMERRAKPSLANAQFDPWKKFKTDPEHFYYRGIPTRPRERSMRESEGYIPITGSEFGDLVLAKLPIDMQQENVAEINDKTKRQEEAAVNQFREEAARHGVETFEEKE